MPESKQVLRVDQFTRELREFFKARGATSEEQAGTLCYEMAALAARDAPTTIDALRAVSEMHEVMRAQIITMAAAGCKDHP
jgi:hypothetical protein